MKFLIAGAFLAAAGCAILSAARVLPPASLLAPFFFVLGLILVLLYTINLTDRRY